jgi:hypothetical protein
MIPSVPADIKKDFRTAPDTYFPEERLWRERAARMTLDALGHTNLTVKPKEHNEAVKYARRWFRGVFNEHPDPAMVDDVQATFDYAGVELSRVKSIVLAAKPVLFTVKDC